MPTPGRQVVNATSRCALYVHVPFCERKCGYCDFFSVPVRGRDTGAFADRLVCEFGTRLTGGASAIRTIFVGGGTPTILPLDQLTDLLMALGRLVPAEGLAEFTVEANPATVDESKAMRLVRAGVTRVSVGAQSFFPGELYSLERIQSPADIPVSLATRRP